jgi:hypothetical protein
MDSGARSQDAAQQKRATPRAAGLKKGAPHENDKKNEKQSGKKEGRKKSHARATLMDSWMERSSNSMRAKMLLRRLSSSFVASVLRSAVSLSGDGRAALAAVVAVMPEVHEGVVRADAPVGGGEEAEEANNAMASLLSVRCCWCGCCCCCSSVYVI